MIISVKELLNKYQPAYGDTWEHAFSIANEDSEVIEQLTHDFNENNGFRSPIILSTPDDETATIFDGMHRITVLNNLNQEKAYVRIGYDEDIYTHMLELKFQYSNVETAEERETIEENADKNISWALINTVNDIADEDTTETMVNCWVNIDYISTGPGLGENMLALETAIVLTSEEAKLWGMIAEKAKEKFTTKNYTPQLKASLYLIKDDTEDNELVDTMEFDK